MTVRTVRSSACINVVRGTGGTHHGPTRLVPHGRLPQAAFVMLRFSQLREVAASTMPRLL
jgi:hypothetical protein